MPILKRRRAVAAIEGVGIGIVTAEIETVGSDIICGEIRVRGFYPVIHDADRHPGTGVIESPGTAYAHIASRNDLIREVPLAGLPGTAAVDRVIRVVWREGILHMGGPLV